jgi:putative DNA primase/helicase
MSKQNKTAAQVGNLGQPSNISNVISFNKADYNKTPELFSILAEQSVLGGLMLDNSAWGKLAGILAEDDFYRSDHKLIYRAISTLSEAGKPFDLVTLAQKLEENKWLTEVGGLGYLRSLVDNTPSTANILAYADIVRKTSLERQLNAAYENHDLAQVNELTELLKSTTDWPEPQPLTAKIKPEPYPINSLPPTIREAVIEVQSFVKAPFPLVANSALGALSLAIQPHADVRRAETLEGPTSLFLLAIADSGERKTTCDRYFTQAIEAHQAEKIKELEPELTQYKADYSAWEAKRDGILNAIRQAGKTGEDTAEFKFNLRQHEQEMPKPPPIPRIILGDETPENQAYSLAKHWPSSGVISSEAGTILGSHGMGKDSITRNLGLLNILWDGGTLSIGRKTSESFTVRDVRLTMALQIQDATLRGFFDGSKGLARGTGFMARFLIAWPDSTQGTRFFIEPPQGMPKLAAFNRRLTEILNRDFKRKENGGLDPIMLDFSPEAKAEWIGFHDSIEAELSESGELYDVRDVASKVADNAARLSALFQVFEHGLDSREITADSFMAAAKVALWHLTEARRFFGGLALPPAIADAVNLDNWLIEHARKNGRTVAKSFIMQNGPYSLRNKAKLDAALAFLYDANTGGRIRLSKNGAKTMVELNPALMGAP